jgi:UTRA domain
LVATPASITGLIASFTRPAGELYGILTAAGHKLDWAETVTGRIPSPDDAASLRIPDGTPMLLTRRVTRDSKSGQPLAMEETRLSADDAQLAYQVTRHERRVSLASLKQSVHCLGLPSPKAGAGCLSQSLARSGTLAGWS